MGRKKKIVDTPVQPISIKKTNRRIKTESGSWTVVLNGVGITNVKFRASFETDDGFRGYGRTENEAIENLQFYSSQ